MNSDSLVRCIKDLVQAGKGILAADESLPTIAKRFTPIKIESTAETRRVYRSLLAETEQLENYISGVILFEETLSQMASGDLSTPTLLNIKGIVAGVKVDKGTINICAQGPDKLTQGLDNLAERLSAYRDLGARFAKWRNVYSITDDGRTSPGRVAVTMGAEILARYASLCQQNDIVPIVEPEVPPRDIARASLDVMEQSVPVAVPSINFLSGGQSDVEANENLQAINHEASSRHLPWLLSFSYGRALQAPVLHAWQGKSANEHLPA